MESQTKKILICGDSFAQDDPRHTGLHFSQKISKSFPIIDWKICNMGVEGASNRLIAQQLLQGMKYEPDFVILLFSAATRREFELDKKLYPAPRSLNPEDIVNWNKTRYDFGGHMIHRNTDRKLMSPDDDIKNLESLLISAYCLEFLSQRKIGFCWSEGGLPEFDYAGNFMSDPFGDYQNKRIPLNLWPHGINDTKRDPTFHVADNDLQESFANMCLNHILDNLDV